MMKWCVFLSPLALLCLGAEALLPRSPSISKTIHCSTPLFQRRASKAENEIDESALCSSSSPTHDLTRRHLFALPLIGLSTQPAFALDGTTPSSPLLPTSVPESTYLETGLLETRVTENVLSPPPYGMESPDVYYPSWFSGTWKVISRTKRVEAPCGIALFGGNTTYQSAKSEIGSSLAYESRFLKGGEGTAIADREYNVKSIAKAAIGENSVMDVPLASPNKFTCILAPKGAPSMLQVDLITLNRRQEKVSENRFDCSEVVREIISPVDKNMRSGPGGGNTASILKEIETTSIYSYDEKRDQVTCLQRSASFILPSQQNPIALKMWEAARGRPVDVRFYDVVYTRRT